VKTDALLIFQSVQSGNHGNTIHPIRIIEIKDYKPYIYSKLKERGNNFA